MLLSFIFRDIHESCKKEGPPFAKWAHQEREDTQYQNVDDLHYRMKQKMEKMSETLKNYQSILESHGYTFDKEGRIIKPKEDLN